MSLNDESGFNDLLEYYQSNKDKPWKEWLKVDKIFPRPGKQGLVGLMTSTDAKQKTYVFKVSQYINYLVEHESTVMKSLNELSTFCPHFCRVVGNITCDIDPTKRKEGNPFIQESKYMIEKDVMLMEYLNNSYKFYNYITSEKVLEDTLYSTVKQTLLAVAIAQKKKKFTHYDLHSNNIMMKRCSKDLVFLYILDEENQFCVSTRGCYPVLIDFGFSYCQELDGGPLWPTLNHTDVGFMSDRFDPFADPKLFLVSVSDEINDVWKSKKSKRLLNITKNNYRKLKIDWDSGWDNDTKKCATDSILKLVQPYGGLSKLFKEYEYYCFDIIQTLIILPLQFQNVSNFDISYTTFLKEFNKIEHEIGTPFYCLYILKGVVDAARVVRADYIREESKDHAIGYFRQAVYERIDSVSSYCRPKTIHFERMLCSLLCLGQSMEGVLFEAMKSRMSKKQEMYDKVPLKTLEELYAVIDINIEDNYQFGDKTAVLVIDAIQERCYPLELDDEQKELMNSFSSISRGTELYRLTKQTHNLKIKKCSNK